MFTIDPQNCPDCAHTDSSHDSVFGCLFPGCPCRVTDPRAAGLLWVAEAPRSAAEPRSSLGRLIVFMSQAGLWGGLIAAVIALVCLAGSLALISRAESAPPPAPPADFPLRTAYQEAPTGRGRHG